MCGSHTPMSVVGSGFQSLLARADLPNAESVIWVDGRQGSFGEAFARLRG